MVLRELTFTSCIRKESESFQNGSLFSYSKVQKFSYSVVRKRSIPPGGNENGGQPVLTFRLSITFGGNPVRLDVKPTGAESENREIDLKK